MAARLLTGGILAVIGLFTIKLVIATLKGLLALVAFLLFTVLPLVVIGWILLRIFRGPKDKPAYD